jgi:hypothetical protein
LPEEIKNVKLINMKGVKITILILGSLVAILGYIFAFMYLFRQEFMPYHAIAVNESWAQVDPRMQVLILALMRVSGGGWLGVSIAMTILLVKYNKTDQLWLMTSLFFVGLAIVVPTLIATLLVKNHSGANPPWIAAAAAILVLLAGWILALIRKNHKPK